MAAFTCVMQSLKFLCRKPSVLFPFPVTFSVCLVQVRLFEIVTPRYLLSSTVSSVCPCRVYEESMTCLGLDGSI